MLRRAGEGVKGRHTSCRSVCGWGGGGGRVWAAFLIPMKYWGWLSSVLLIYSSIILFYFIFIFLSILMMMLPRHVLDMKENGIYVRIWWRNLKQFFYFFLFFLTFGINKCTWRLTMTTTTTTAQHRNGGKKKKKLIYHTSFLISFLFFFTCV